MSTIEIRAESGQVETATARLNSLREAGTAAAQTADRVESATSQANATIGAAGRVAEQAAQKQEKLNSSMNAGTTASQRFAGELGGARTALLDFITQQTRAGRTISETGDVLTASGTKASKSTAEYAKLQAKFVDLQNTADDVADAMARTSSATAKNQAAALAAANAEERLQDEARETVAALEKEIKATARATAARKEYATAQVTAGAGVSRFGSKAAQAGIQIEQLVTSLSAGAPIAQAFAFQAADLGIVLGLPLLGSIVAVTAALAGPFINSLFDSESASDKLAAALDKVDRVMTNSDAGITEYTDAIRELAKVSEEAANGRLRAAILDAKVAAEEASRGIADSFQDAFDVGDFIVGGIEEAVSAARAAGSKLGPELITGVGRSLENTVADELGESLGASAEKARELGTEIIELIASAEQFKTPEAFRALELRLNELSQNATPGVSNKIDSLIGDISDLVDAGVDASQRLETLQLDVSPGSEGGPAAEPVKDYTDAVERMVQQLDLQNRALSDGKLSADLYAAAMATGAGSVEDLDPTIAALIISIDQQQKAIEDAAQAKRDEAKANADLRNELAAEVAQRKAAADAVEEQAKAAEKYNTFIKSLEAENDPAARAKQIYDERLAVIQEHYQLVSALEAENTEAGVLALQRYEEALASIRDKNEDGFFADLSDSFSGLSDTISGTAASVALGFQDADDAAASLAQTVATQLLGAVVSWGIETAAAALKGLVATQAAEVGKTAAITTAIGTQTAAAVTSAGTVASTQSAAMGTIAAASAPAAAGASIATFGGAAISGTAIALGGIAAIMAAIAIGGRSQGGDVKGGQFYRVNEWDQEYFMPYTDGRIVNPTQQANGGGGSGNSVVMNNVMNVSTANASEFSRPRSRRQIEAAQYRGYQRAYERNR